mmetsp:Transcript_32337/g.66489  ORF Transcript_32337/g.66489 Transcript_32337/m.66489 type:complete len:100 (+) Transcript_32337:29-328(+)
MPWPRCHAQLTAFLCITWRCVEVFPYQNDTDQGVMLPGMTFTVEPVLVENFDETYTKWDDNWTFQTLTNARSAQFEHTILITEDGCEILTGPSVMDFIG